MLELLLLLGLIVFLIGSALMLKNPSRQNKFDPRAHKRNLFMIALGFTAFLFSCGNDNAEENRDDSLNATYDEYITQAELDSIQDEIPDSMGVLFSQREYQGMGLFMTHCNKCHPGGNKGEGPSLNDKPLPDFMIHFQIRNGLGDMPAFKEDQISRDDVKKIVLFVRAMRENYKGTN